MHLDVYISVLQVQDFGQELIVGHAISLELVGNPGNTLGVSVPALDTFMADEGKKQLLRTGIAEYAFSGEIRQTVSQQMPGNIVGQEIFYVETLLDCGLPIVFVTQGISTISPDDFDRRGNREFIVGRYLSGLMSLRGHISFREPALISAEIQAKIVSISVIDLAPKAVRVSATEEHHSVDPRGIYLPIVLRIDVPA